VGCAFARSTRSARLLSAIATTTTLRGGRRGSWASPPMRTCRPSRLGAVTSLAWRLTRATCRGRPRHPCPATLNCHRRTGRRRRGATRLWARAHARRLPPSERTSGWSVPVRRPAGRVLPSRGGLRLVKSTLREGRRKGLRPPANSTTDRSAPTLTPCRGAGRGGSHRTRRRCRVRRRWRSLVPPPRHLQSLLIQGDGAPDVHVSLVAGGATVRPRPS
jgi:hypothetical protein